MTSDTTGLGIVNLDGGYRSNLGDLNVEEAAFVSKVGGA